MNEAQGVRSRALATAVKKPQIVNPIGSKKIHCTEKSADNIPNETTLRTIREADEGINLHHFNNADEMFAALGI